MVSTLAPLVALLISIFTLMLGNGLINILLPVRMGLDGVETDTIGLVLSLYAVGMLFGGIYSRHLIARVGHIRMFAASAAIGSVSILACGMMSDALLWGAMRILMGFSNAVAFAVIDGWLSEQSTRENRGRILAINQAIIMLAMFSGQFLLNIASPTSQQLFMLCGILLCLAVIPVTTSRNHAPEMVSVEHIPILRLFRLSPLGVTSAFFCGILYSAILSMLPVFSSAKGFAGLQLSQVMGAAIFGAFLLQFPVGYLCDRYGRRTIMLYILLTAIAASLAVPQFANDDHFWFMLPFIAITGGIIACLYPISISEIFDRLRQREMLAAMGSIIAIYAGGSILGPLLSASVMEAFGADGFFFFIAVVQLLLIVFIFYRIQVRDALPIDEQEEFVMHDATISGIELDPRTLYEETHEPRSQETETIASIARNDPSRALELANALVAGALESDQGQAVEIAMALAEVQDFDLLQLYKTLSEAAPNYRQEIAESIAVAAPEQVTEIVSQLMEDSPENRTEAVIAITQVTPEKGIDIVEAAAEASFKNRPEDASEVVTEIAEAFATTLSHTRDELRYTDRAYDKTNQTVAAMVHRLADISPELAVSAATAVVETMPEVASAVVAATPEVADEVARTLKESTG